MALLYAPVPAKKSCSSKSYDWCPRRRTGGGTGAALGPAQGFFLPQEHFLCSSSGFFFLLVAYKVDLMAFPDTLQSDKAANTRKAQMNFNARWKH